MWRVLFLSNLAISFGTPDLNFRRDVTLDDKEYPEMWAPYPEEGGRVQFVSSTSRHLNVTYPLTINLGEFSIALDASYNLYPDNIPTNGLDWIHCTYNPDTGSLLTSLHAHTNSFLKSITKLHVMDSEGQVLLSDENVVIEKFESPPLQVTYVTTRNGFSEIVVHLHNYGDSDLLLNRIIISNAIDLSLPVILSPKTHTVQVFDASTLVLQETSLWTIVLYWENISVDEKIDTTSSSSAGYGGRLIKEIYPIEDWPKGEQCPFPVAGANEDNFIILRDELSVNTHFMGGTCSANTTDIFIAAAESQGEWYLLPSEFWFLYGPDVVPSGVSAGIAAAFVGDESDGSLEKTWDVWNRILTVQRDYSGLATYDGGHSHRLNGAFAGVSDIQGMDFYIGACAPHVTSWLSPMRIQGSFDYLFTARQNQKPLPTWLYSQGWCKDCWSVKDLNAGEVVLQLASVLAAGAKGMMLFQSDVSLRNSTSWVTGGQFLRSLKTISPILRESDVEGALFTTTADLNTEAIMSILASPSALVFVVINTLASGYDDKTCALTNQHWIFQPLDILSTNITIPSYLTTQSGGSDEENRFEVKEVVNGEYISTGEMSGVSTVVNGDTWELSHLAMGTDMTARVFVLFQTV